MGVRGEELRERVKERYAGVARSVVEGGRVGYRAVGLRVRGVSTPKRLGWTGPGAAIRPEELESLPGRRARLR